MLFTFGAGVAPQNPCAWPLGLAILGVNPCREQHRPVQPGPSSDYFRPPIGHTVVTSNMMFPPQYPLPCFPSLTCCYYCVPHHKPQWKPGDPPSPPRRRTLTETDGACMLCARRPARDISLTCTQEKTLHTRRCRNAVVVNYSIIVVPRGPWRDDTLRAKHEASSHHDVIDMVAVRVSCDHTRVKNLDGWRAQFTIESNARELGTVIM